jgi:hypothetical protein
MLRRLPDAALRRLVPGLRGAAEVVPLAALVPDRPHRLLIGPANSAGQGALWARAIERARADAGAVAMVVGGAGGSAFAADQVVPLARYRWSEPWARQQRDAVAGRFTAVLAESGRPLFGDVGRSPRRELEGLRDAGLLVGLVFHGSDLRSPRRHAAGEWSPFREPWSRTPLLELRAAENRRLARELGAPVYVTTPDLLDEVPDARWLPVVVDIERWSAVPPAPARTRPLVAHLPSSGRMKGTDLIEPALRRLEGEGLIEYRRIEGVSHAELPAHLEEVDIVLDQFRIGAYGTVAVEAMAAGRIAVAHIAPEVRGRIEALAGMPAPVVEATPDSLADVLRDLLADPARSAGLRAAGPDYARSVHDGRLAVAALAPLLGG